MLVIVLLPKKLELSESELNEIEKFARKTKKAREYKRATAVILKSKGFSYISIAEQLGIGLRSAQRHVAKYEKFGIKSFEDKKRTGRPPKLTKEAKEMLLKAALKSPKLFGFIKNNWSLEMLCLFLFKETGIKMSDEQIRRTLKANGISCKRPKIVAKGSNDWYREKRLKNYKKVASALYKKNFSGI